MYVGSRAAQVRWLVLLALARAAAEKAKAA